jgi:FMN-dependent NADH-azoreductase
VECATGGVYDVGTPRADLNFIEPYLRSLFAFMGMTETNFVTASGTSRLRFGVDRETILQPALRSIQAQFQAA